MPSAICIDLFGSRKVAVFGATLQTFGLLMSTFVNKLPLYLLTYGIFYGIGKGFLAQATFQILPHYFVKRLGFANGLMNFGGSIVAILFMFLSDQSLAHVGMKESFLIFTGVSSITILAAFLFKSVLNVESGSSDMFLVKVKRSFAKDVLKRRELTVWWVSSFFAQFGIMMTYVTIVCILCWQLSSKFLSLLKGVSLLSG